MRVSISATFTAEPIRGGLEFWLDELGYKPSFEFAPFNQVFQSLLDPQSVFARNQGGVNVVLLRWQDLGRFIEVEQNAQSLLDTLATVKLPSPLIVVSCQSSPLFLASGATPMVKQLDQELSGLADRHSGLHKVTAADLNELYLVADYFSELSDELAHIPFTEQYYAALGTIVARKIDCLKRTPAKVIVLDLDNTLWGGIVGEDSSEGIVLDNPRIDLQRFLLYSCA